MIKLFPSIADVFIDDFDGNSKHFLPIASVDLTEIDKTLSGKVHLVYFNNDPYCKASYESFNEFCDDSRVSFDIVSDKYKFKTDFGYFSTNADWLEWLEKGRISYNENSLKYSQKQDLEISEVIKNLGGTPEWMQTAEWPTNLQGDKLMFVCQIWSGDFVSDYCEEEILLFYDRANQRAIQIHQVD